MSKKARDGQGRWRSMTIGVRVSPGENEEINTLATLAGMTKQDYAITRMLNREVIVYGNPKVYKALRKQMEDLILVISKLKCVQDISPETIHVLEVVSEIYLKMKYSGTNTSWIGVTPNAMKDKEKSIEKS